MTSLGFLMAEANWLREQRLPVEGYHSATMVEKQCNGGKMMQDGS